MTVQRAPALVNPFVSPPIDPSNVSNPADIARQLNTRFKRLETTIAGLTRFAYGTANWTPVTSATYPATANDETLALDATTGNVVATIPLSQTAPGKMYGLVRTDTSGHTATAALTTGDTVGTTGATTITATTSLQIIQSDGGGHWWLISGGAQGPQGNPGNPGAPGTPGAPGAAGAAGLTLLLDPEVPDDPFMVLGPPGAAGAPGAPGLSLIMDPELPDDPMLVLGPPGATGATGAQGPAQTSLAGTLLLDLGSEPRRSGHVDVTLPVGSAFSRAQLVTNGLMVTQAGGALRGKSADEAEHVQVHCTAEILSTTRFRVRWLAVGQSVAWGSVRLLYTTIGA